MCVSVDNSNVTMKEEDLNPKHLCRRLLDFHKFVNVINVGFIPYKLLIFFFKGSRKFDVVMLIYGRLAP